MFGLGIGETIAIIVGSLAILGFVVDRFLKPNARQDIKITEIDGNLGKTDMKVNANTKCIEEIGKDVKEIKDNHLVHLKDDINKMGNDIVEIKTILKK